MGYKENLQDFARAHNLPVPGETTSEVKFKLKPEYSTMHYTVVVEFFLMLNDDWFENKKNSFFGRKYKFRKYLLEYILDPDYPNLGDTDLIYCSSKFREYLEWFDREEK